MLPRSRCLRRSRAPRRRPSLGRRALGNDIDLPTLLDDAVGQGVEASLPQSVDPQYRLARRQRLEPTAAVLADDALFPETRQRRFAVELHLDAERLAKEPLDGLVDGPQIGDVDALL